jgi:hypothetical protein
MGYQPLPSKPKKQEAQPKDERPPLQGYGDQLEGGQGEEVNPPQGGSVIARYRSPVVSANPLLNRPPNPALDIVYGKPPRPRVDPDLIGDYYQ